MTEGTSTISIMLRVPREVTRRLRDQYAKEVQERRQHDPDYDITFNKWCVDKLAKLVR